MQSRIFFTIPSDTALGSINCFPRLFGVPPSIFPRQDEYSSSVLESTPFHLRVSLSPRGKPQLAVSSEIYPSLNQLQLPLDLCLSLLVLSQLVLGNIVSRMRYDQIVPFPRRILRLVFLSWCFVCQRSPLHTLFFRTNCSPRLYPPSFFPRFLFLG